MRKFRTEINLEKYDPFQVSLLKEDCILVDREDKRIGKASKKNCHLRSDVDDGILHRAFSVFLFDEQGRLLLQQRSKSKITFPLFWTNSCCSHPLANPMEIEEEDQIGIRRAAQRKLNQELGINPDELDLNSFHYLTRIHYSASSDLNWGENEVDYILFLKKKVNIVINPLEVNDVLYVSQQELRDFIEYSKTNSLVKITPWFLLIVENYIWKWWDALLDGVLDRYRDDIIHHYT
ncbi:isopentenyl-diphosphate Delta-isomerase 1-like [Schistocerca gregaria]|uniref:isopentenyl-diphosphate Delta-isomerase 1-like n=1 Tax=Schistocerca gregaria TaxID=7010 RepID=UPI00211DD45B|nr:isopentenyl-diphosphate Delta-isomerase 1-like [Schistocerca gregaria]